MAKTTGSTAVADRPADALWLAALPKSRVGGPEAALPAPAEPAEGMFFLSGAPITDMAVSPDGAVVVAAQCGQDMVAVVDTADLTVRAIVNGVAEPRSIAVGDRAYVTTSGIEEDGVVAVGLAGGVALATRHIDASVRGLAVSPAGDVLYAARNTDTAADIAVIDVRTGMLSSIPVSTSPGETADVVRLNGDGTRLYVTLTSASGADLAVVDLRARSVLRTVPLSGSIGDIAVHRDGRRVLATGWDDELGGALTVIDSAAGRVVETIALGGLPTQVVLAGARAYVLVGGRIAILDFATSRIAEVTGIDRPVSCLAVNPTGTRLYIADFAGTVVARAAVGEPEVRAAC